MNYSEKTIKRRNRILNGVIDVLCWVLALLAIFAICMTQLM